MRLLVFIAVLLLMIPACRQVESHEQLSLETKWDNGSIRKRSSYYMKERNEILHGEQVEWFEEGGVRMRVNYSHGKRHGLLSEWYPNGVKAREGRWENGFQVGIWTAWQPSGDKKWEASYENGVIIGKRVSWSSGKVVLEEMYEDGDVVEVLGYHLNGIKSLHGHYQGGLKHGVWQHWDEKGVMVADGEWKAGLPWNGVVSVLVDGDAGSMAGLSVFREYRDGKEIK